MVHHSGVRLHYMWNNSKIVPYSKDTYGRKIQRPNYRLMRAQRRLRMQFKDVVSDTPSDYNKVSLPNARLLPFSPLHLPDSNESMGLACSANRRQNRTCNLVGKCSLSTSNEGLGPLVWLSPDSGQMKIICYH